jgi:hypothetical protein
VRILESSVALHRIYRVLGSLALFVVWRLPTFSHFILHQTAGILHYSLHAECLDSYFILVIFPLAVATLLIDRDSRTIYFPIQFNLMLFFFHHTATATAYRYSARHFRWANIMGSMVWLSRDCVFPESRDSFLSLILILFGYWLVESLRNHKCTSFVCVCERVAYAYSLRRGIISSRVAQCNIQWEQTKVQNRGTLAAFFLAAPSYATRYMAMHDEAWSSRRTAWTVLCFRSDLRPVLCMI